MLTICAAFVLLTLVAASPLLAAEAAQRRFLAGREVCPAPCAPAD
jgi:hypothetical protein